MTKPASSISAQAGPFSPFSPFSLYALRRLHRTAAAPPKAIRADPRTVATSAGQAPPDPARSAPCRTDTASPQREQRLAATAQAQSAIVAASLLQLEALAYYGLVPDIVLGHSLGESSALAAAGRCTADAAVHLAAARGRAMQRRGRRHGAMLAVAADEATVATLLQPLARRLVVANYE